MLNYIRFTSTGRNSYEQRTIHLSAKNQELVELPAGFAGIYLGYETREEEGGRQRDSTVEAGLSTGNAAQSTSGDYSLDELFVEINAPIIDGMVLNVAGRTSDYSNFGTTTNMKYGLRYDIIEGVLAVRGTMSEAFNAPSISALYDGIRDSYPAASDPCSSIEEVGSYNTNPIVKANCDADGIGATGDPAIQLRARLGGNPNLMPETAETATFGIVYQPLDDLAINIDYFSYKLEDTVGTIGANGILGACYFTTNRSRCDAIERNSDGIITNIYANTSNIGKLENSGYDIQVDYGFDTSFGRFDIALDYTILSEYTLSAPSSDGVSTVETECVDVFDCGVIIDGRMIVDIDWSYDQMSSRVRLNRYPAFEECQGDNCNSSSSIRRDIEEVTYVSASFGYNFEQGTRAQLTVQNLLDEEPPRMYYGSYSAASPSYDFLGRYVGLTLSHEF
jgi:outer membrane receptor protein involved in Fe transport